MHDILTILLPIVLTGVLVMVVIIFVIKRLLLSDTMQAVSRIRQVEAEVRKREEAIRREIEEHEKEFARKKIEAEEELQRQRESSEKEVAKLREQMIADAKKEGDTIIEQARKNEEKIRKQISQDMEEKTVDYGGQVFKMVMSEKMNEEMNKQFISELLDAIEQIDSTSITVDPSNAEFRSSHPLEAGQKARLESLLAEKFGARIKVNEKIEPELMAGLVFKMGSLEIDGSLVNRFQEAAGELKKTVTGA
jgi:F0F1-type ATP synthase membrane subunit b/b'